MTLTKLTINGSNSEVRLRMLEIADLLWALVHDVDKVGNADEEIHHLSAMADEFWEKVGGE